MSTMTDVARLAGVSVSTVSYALNGTRPISEQTRQQIFAAMAELGYRPNLVARALASKRSRIIALLFPIPERGLGSTELAFVSSAADAARENGYNLVLWSLTSHDPSELRDLIQEGLADGVVVMEVHLNDDRVDMLLESGFPFTMIGRTADPEGIAYADIDFARTTATAVEHLAALGHRHIAFLNHSQAEFVSGYGPAVRADAAFHEVIAEMGLHGVTRLCRASPAAGFEAFSELLAAHPELTALVAMNDQAMAGVLQVIADRGWRVPADFSLLTMVSSARVAELMLPPMTFAAAPTAELGRHGVEMLIRQLEGASPDMSHELVPCPLIVQGSTGPAPRRTQESVPAGAPETKEVALPG